MIESEEHRDCLIDQILSARNVCLAKREKLVGESGERGLRKSSATGPVSNKQRDVPRKFSLES